MAQVRALVDTFADNLYRKAGDVFDFAGEIGPGLEPVNKATNKAARAAAQQAITDAFDKADALRRAATVAQAAVAAEPGRSDLAAAQIAAEDAASNAEREAAKLQENSGDFN